MMKRHSLAGSGCSNKASYTGCLKQQNMFLIALRAGNSKIKLPQTQSLIRVQFREGLLTVSSHGIKKGKRVL